MVEKVLIDGIELLLSTPDVIPNMKWIGGDIYMSQLLAAWLVVDTVKDIPMNPQILGKPGVGKTTLAYSAADHLKSPIYIMQCTVDTRPEDLIITPVIGENNTIRYHASPLVSAMIRGGVCILDEANRMAEKSWASLAPLLDQRRYIESIIAGIKIQAHDNFRICCTMNEDSTTFEIPEYIHSRLQPQIFIDFPNREEEMQILEFNLPYARKDIITYTVNFLQQAHHQNKNYTIRDGINICRYYLKLEEFQSAVNSIKNRKKQDSNEKPKIFPNHENSINLKLFNQAIGHILGPEAQNFLLETDDSRDLRKMNNKFRDMFDQLNSVFYEDKTNEDEVSEDNLDPNMEDMGFFEEMDDPDLYYMENHEDEEEFEDLGLKANANQDKILRIIEEENEDAPSDDPLHRDFYENEIEHSKQSADPNEIVREFLKRREKRRLKEQNSQNNDEKRNNESNRD